MTVRENEAKHSKKDVLRARKAQQFIVNSGYSSLRDARNLVSDGNITGLDITRRDVELAQEISG